MRDGFIRHTESPRQNVRNGRRNAGSGQVDGEVSDSDSGDRCKDNIANTPYEGRDYEDQAPLLCSVRNESCNVGEQVRGEVRRSREALRVNITVSHLGQYGGKVDWQARIAHIDAKIHHL